jgi:hypothetical protein
MKTAGALTVVVKHIEINSNNTHIAKDISVHFRIER